MADVEVLIKANHLPRIGSRFPSAVADIMNSGILNIVAAADPNTPVDTGALKANKTLDFASPGKLNGSITWNQEYSAYVNGGTVRQAPRPFATNAADQVFPQIVQALSSLEGQL